MNKVEYHDIIEQNRQRRLKVVRDYFSSRHIDMKNGDVEHYAKSLMMLEVILDGEDIPIPKDIFEIGMNYLSRRRDMAGQAGVHWNDINPLTNPVNYIKNARKAIYTQGSHTKAGVSPKLGKDELKDILKKTPGKEDYIKNLHLFVNPKFKECFDRRFLSDTQQVKK